MLPFFMVFENRKPKAREIVLIAMMSALTVCVHIFFHITLPLQIGTAMIIISGISLGPEAGFLIGAISRFVCNFYMGQGPWTPWQMFCWGILGFLAGMAFNLSLIHIFSILAKREAGVSPARLPPLYGRSVIYYTTGILMMPGRKMTLRYPSQKTCLK